MNLELRARLVRWAEADPRIARLWVFGSRANGTAREDSDLDLAVQVIPQRPEDESEYAAFYFSYQQWERQLRMFVPFAVHLCHYWPSERVGAQLAGTTIALEVERGGLQLYPELATHDAKTPNGP